MDVHARPRHNSHTHTQTPTPTHNHTHRHTRTRTPRTRAARACAPRPATGAHTFAPPRANVRARSQTGPQRQGARPRARARHPRRPTPTQTPPRTIAPRTVRCLRRAAALRPQPDRPRGRRRRAAVAAAARRRALHLIVRLLCHGCIAAARRARQQCARGTAPPARRGARGARAYLTGGGLSRRSRDRATGHVRSRKSISATWGSRAHVTASSGGSEAPWGFRRALSRPG